MKRFLLNTNTSNLIFESFSFIHIISIILVVIVFILILYNKKKLISINKSNKKIIRIIFGLILVIFYIIRRGSFLYYGVYNWKNHLSLGFCNMTSLLFIFYCFTGNKKIYNICYYCTFSGPLLSILIPSVNIGINNYAFINFIMIHHFIFLMNLLFCIFEKKKSSKKDFITAYIIMIMYMFFCYSFNYIFGTHYNYLDNFLNDYIRNLNFVSKIINYDSLGFIILVMIGTGMVLLGYNFLKLIESEENYEKK